MTTFASPVDTATHGVYRVPATPGPLYRRTGRVPDATKRGRYHLYGATFCPWWQRVAITRVLAGLQDVVSMSFVDGERDGRGWAFRETHGPDPVNGFTLLRQAYEAGDPGFDGHVSVPALWDRDAAQLLSNDSTAIGIDFATRFQHLATPLVMTYPAPLREQIEQVDAWLTPVLIDGMGAAAAGPGPARDALLDTFRRLDELLADQRYLTGGELTEADIRLWVRLVRFDSGPNAARDIIGGLDSYPQLWSYARDLYAVPAFRDTTDFAAFSSPHAVLADWDRPAQRAPR
ncbi:glutathione S-transferase C-terminal domain-containing protein [Actinoplanes sp. TFC3]|uniref:glutathione S-transferase C-terminal domain-containing protein n=1 Tax=Actinoplanes sp. TFC3 TaxID=1710355 RepID=UPI0008337087|nr:glutathione S-transferase C-terminal domain-containing protein [Actinoplanes sp. TFC3]